MFIYIIFCKKGGTFAVSLALGRLSQQSSHFKLAFGGQHLFNFISHNVHGINFLMFFNNF